MRFAVRDGGIAVDCPSCAACDPSQPGCATPLPVSAAPLAATSSSAGGTDKLKLILAIVVPVSVALLAVLTLAAYCVRTRRKRAVPTPAPLNPPMHEVKAKGSMRSVNSTGTDGQSSGTHISTLPPYSPSRASGSPSPVRGRPPLPPRHEVDAGVCVGPPDELEYEEDDASSTSSFGVVAPQFGPISPQFEFDTGFTHTHRSLSPVPEERESMMTRNSTYSMCGAPSVRSFASGFHDNPAVCPITAAQQFRDMTLAHWPTTPPPPPPCHPMRARAYSGTYTGPPVVL